jgi:hypothetical protein
MTKQLERLYDTLREQLSRGVWPPDQRVLIDAYAALHVWRGSGAHVFRLRPGVRSPAIAPDLRLADALIEREAQLYVLGREEWIVVARVAALRGLDVAPGRVLAFRQALLVYCTMDADERLLAGHVSMEDQPTPRQMRLLPGTTTAEMWSRPLDAEEIAIEGVRLARVLPWFFCRPPGGGLTRV